MSSHPAQHTLLCYERGSLFQWPQSLMILCPYEGSPGRALGWGQEAKGTYHHLDRFLGEFGSVREAQLKQEDGSFVKVAVKMLKGEWRIVLEWSEDVTWEGERGG